MRAYHLAICAALLAAEARAARPEVSFTPGEFGFVEVRVEQDGRPVRPVVIQAFDGAGNPVADDDGSNEVGSIPPLRGGCRVVLTVAGKECDPILLRVHGKDISPARVQLTFGDRSCCRRVVRPTDEAPEPAEPTGRAGIIWPGAVGGGCLIVAALVLALRWRAGERIES